MGIDYEIRLTGAFPAELAEGLCDVQELQEPVSSLLVCRLHDQAELHGLLARISMLGLDVLEVRALPAGPGLPEWPAPGAPA